MVRMFDLRQLAVPIAACRQQAIAEIRAAQRDELGNDFFKATVWEFAAQQVIKRSTIPLDADDLSECVGLISLNALDESNEVSRLLATLDAAGFSVHLLARLWEEYSADAKSMELPCEDQPNATPASTVKGKARKGKRGRRPLSDEETREREILIAEWDRAKGAGVSQKQFCRDKGIAVKRLSDPIDWKAARKRRRQIQAD